MPSKELVVEGTQSTGEGVVRRGIAIDGVEIRAGELIEIS